ncbi:uncharacterized protein EI97DRAFT_372839 [Westerdykella ornata]|uniref:PDZ GRASP-type domain-containing protein n=1 Tax=Westerdykella ornata TaxID=318751 RepID=A0A6A6JS17_WESOR|nr:uncharacterized protein EI97DRAFT_372839 [Westerdykella ornata]KAF2278526.1 hypothetical protein EI97DRAFT_372839 [Westerdykella ornata]
MFGALNRFISRLDAAPEDQSPASQGGYGFQVLRNTNPEVPLEPWFDFIIGINGHTIDNPDPNLFATEVRNCAGTTVSLGIYSAKGQKIREIFLPIPASSPTLGISLQWTPLSTSYDVWHILDVIPNSPAEQAGLLPYGDYVIGSPEGLVRGESGLGELVEDFLNRPLPLFVYNHEYNVTRPVTITPSRTWGGDGALGCVLGFGALHRIPAPLEEPPQAPGETLFAAGTGAGTSQHTSFDEKRGGPEAGGTGLVGNDAAAATAAADAGLDDYFREGEIKSQEEDYAPRPKGDVPPPPRVGAAAAAGPPPKGGPGGPPRSGTGTPVQGSGEREGKSEGGEEGKP